MSTNNSDRAQLNLMKEGIERYTRGDLPLLEFIEEQDGLVDELTGIDEKWCDEYRDLVTQLDIISLALDEEGDGLSAADEAKVKGIVAKLSANIQARG